MPYLKPADRARVDKEGPSTPGELNYALTKVIENYILGVSPDTLHYVDINDVIGAIEGAKLEFYLRIARPYEDIKSNENGDVYERLLKKIPW